MILNTEELKQAIRKKLDGEAVVLPEIEAHLQKSTGPDMEGLLAVTPSRVLFAHRPAFGEPEVLVYARTTLSVIEKKEDIFGASMKVKSGDEQIEFKKINPSDFKQLVAQLAIPGTEVKVEIVPEPQLGEMIETAEPLAPEPVEQPRKTDSFTTPSLQTMCAFHPDTDASTKCDACWKAICPDCENSFNDKTYCPECLVREQGKTKAALGSKIARMQQKREQVKPAEVAPPGKPKGPPPPPEARKARSPALAFLLSFMPGFGQFYSGDARGVLTLFTSALFILGLMKRLKYEFSLTVLDMFPSLKQLFSAEYTDEKQWVIMGILALPFLWSFIDAPSRSNRRNKLMGLQPEPAGCLTFLFIIYMTAMGMWGAYELMAFARGNHTPTVPSQAARLPAGAVQQIPGSEIDKRCSDLAQLLAKYNEIQRKYYAEHQEYMTEIPADFFKENRTGFYLQQIMPQSRTTQYIVYAWAVVGPERMLDLWTTDQTGSLSHVVEANLSR